MDETLDRLRLERDIAKKTAGDLMEENRLLRNQPELLAEQAKTIQELRQLLGVVLNLLVRPLVGKKSTPRHRPRAFVDVGRIVEANEEVLSRAADQVRLLSSN